MHTPSPLQEFFFPRPAFAVLTIAALTACTTAPPGVPTPDTAHHFATAPVNVVIETDVSDPAQKFARWVRDFRADAQAAGIEPATLAMAFDDVRFLPSVIESDGAQPELTRTPWDYLDRAMSEQRITRGQEKLLQLRSDIEPIVAKYGVPLEILFAIWAMESSYGSFAGNISTIDALATLGFHGRREAWARAQLLAALKILQNRDIDRARMVGSWAGAMGQTQFLPSTYLAYAVDADGDGRRDIWGSVADVMASTANFVAKSGWQSGQSWGVEVRLPPAFDYAQADMAVRKSAAAWADRGVQSVDQSPLPAWEESSILLPAGARGPAFVVGPNFRTILRYNNSTNYALAVGLLAQRFANGPTWSAAWPRDVPALSRGDVTALQAALNARGFDVGTPDGLVGPATRSGVRKYQQSVGLPADGYPTAEILKALQPQAAVPAVEIRVQPVAR